MECLPKAFPITSQNVNVMSFKIFALTSINFNEMSFKIATETLSNFIAKVCHKCLSIVDAIRFANII